MEIENICWTSPSNIAIVKYWGKRNIQIPLNPSFSFTLDKCHTKTSLSYKKGNGQIKFTFDDQPNDLFELRIINFINSLSLDFLQNYNLTINSINTFPHSAGIASSASSMSALCLCITEMQEQIEFKFDDFRKTVSERSRLASGSACRSIFPIASVWGKSEFFQGSSDNFGIDWSKNIHQDFHQLQDWIMIVNQLEKSVSSSAGHELMKNHPYSESRIQQANKNIEILKTALKFADWDSFIRIAEEEALSLHALMMTSNPSYLLLEPESIAIIKAIQRVRKESNIPICFTIDAGPNIHILFPEKHSAFVKSWLQAEFNNYLQENKVIFDNVGIGPKKC